MKRIVFLTCLAGATIYSAAADQRIAFERNDAVHIANMEASLIRKLGEGVFPAIAPDAKSVAFTAVELGGGNSVRKIAVMEIASGKRRLFDSIPGDNSYYCTWSADGSSLAFTVRADNVWNLCVVKADGTDFRVIKKGVQDKVVLYSPCWARDGKSLFCQDMTNIYRIGLDGSILAEWKIGRIVPNGGMSGDGRIDIAPDGNRLLLSVEMDEEYDRKDWDGPVPALWSFDLSTEAAVRLTSRNLFAWDGCWLDGANILFVSQRSGDQQPALYRTNGKTLKRLIEDARHPTVSRP